MIYRYEYDNYLKINIWVDEFPMASCKSTKTIEKIYEANGQTLGGDKLMALEIAIPRDACNYGLLGIRYHEKNQEAIAVIHTDDYGEEEYKDNISLIHDVVYKGIPEDYSIGIEQGLERVSSQHRLKCGGYEFIMGAHGEAGSCIAIFSVVCGMLLDLLYETDITKEKVLELFMKNLHEERDGEAVSFGESEVIA